MSTPGLEEGFDCNSGRCRLLQPEETPSPAAEGKSAACRCKFRHSQVRNARWLSVAAIPRSVVPLFAQVVDLMQHFLFAGI
jgi:hypothetical protein